MVSFQILVEEGMERENQGVWWHEREGGRERVSKGAHKNLPLTISSTTSDLLPSPFLCSS